MPLDVSAGDTITVAITQQSSGVWLIVIRDSANEQSWQNTISYKSSRSSAEWIEEAPAEDQHTIVPLDRFGAITFTAGSTVENGQTCTVAQAGGQPITMANSLGQALAQPSALGADSASFTVTRTNVSAPRPAPGIGNFPFSERLP